MPRPRFEKLDAKRRHQILDAAAEAFAQDGLHGTSLNQLLSKTNITKGLFYYYFDDKMDLYMTLLNKAIQHFEVVFDKHPAVDDLSISNFWDCLESSYQDLFVFSVSHPTTVGIVKTLTDLPPEEIAHLKVEARCLDWLQRYLERGQALGMIRDDLPMEVLTQLTAAVDTSMGEWLFANWGDDLETLKAMTPKIITMYRRILEVKVQFP